MAKHTHSQLDAPNVMSFEEFDDKSESDKSINPNGSIEDDTIILFISKFGKDFVLNKWSFFIDINRKVNKF